MNCPRCGAVVGEHSLFCAECGASLTAPRDTKAVTVVPAVGWVPTPASIPVVEPSDPGDTVIPAPQPPAEETSEPTDAPPEPPATWVAVLPDGTRAPLDGTVLLGRKPSPHPGWPTANLLTIDDPDKSVSKSHAVIEVSDGAVTVTDLGSTNGTLVLQPDGAEADLGEGETATLGDGAVLTLGDLAVRIERG